MIYAPRVLENDLESDAVVDGSVPDLAEALEARSDDIALAMHELAHLLVAEESVATTLQRVADLAATVIEDCDAAGVTLLSPDGGYETAAYTAQRTLAVDRGQYERDHGPCLQAIAEKRVVRLDVEEAEELWPDFVRDARANDIRSFLAAPLLLNGAAIGSLNVYSAKPTGFDGLDDVLVALFTGQASVAVANARLYADALRLTQQLNEAIASRAVIEQAKGVLMAEHGIDDDAAFSRLREDSQRRNVKLRDIARQIVEAT